MYKVKIPMKAHLAQFLRFRLGITLEGTLYLSQRCAITSHLILLFTTKTKCAFDDIPKPQEYDDHIYVHLQAKNIKYGEIFLDHDRVHRWNQFVHNKMHEYLDTRISVYQLHGGQIKDAIWDFIHDADMEDLISFDALKKTNDRLRRARAAAT